MTIATSQQIAPETATTFWDGFRTGLWLKEINVRDFIQQNYEPYEGDGSFLATATERTNEVIVGLQTEAPLKRAIMPNGGLRMVLIALKAYGYEPDPRVVEAFSKYRKTHNEGVFDAYTADVRRCRSSHILTGLPDAYGRGRIIGDYRRVAHSAQAGGETQPRFRHVDRRHHSRPRRTQ
jgi:formate C-acetyltransferase